MRLPKMVRKGTKESSPFQHGSASSGGHDLNSISSSSFNSVSLRSIQIEEEFQILKTLADGTFSKVYLAKRSATDGEKLVLKAIHCDLTSIDEFNREVNLTYFLSPHPNILTCYAVSFIWNNSYVFVQEHATFGPLSRFVQKGGLPEKQVKLVAQQVASALEFMHEANLVHRDVTLDNVLVFKANLSRVKLSDFGCTRSLGSLVILTESSQSQRSWATFAPPEICDLLPQEKYHCYPSSDVWQLGILIFKCLSGSAPWTCADITDPVYRNYTSWLRRKSLRMPEQLKIFTSRFVRLFKRLLEPKSANRSEAREVMKYLKDDWVRVRRTPSFSSSTGTEWKSKETKQGLLAEGVKVCNSFEVRVVGGNNGQISGLNGLKEVRSLKELGLDTEIDKKRVEAWIAATLPPK